MQTKSLVFLPGNHLYPTSFLQQFRDAAVVMVEDIELCSRRCYHQQKLALLIAAMREYAQQLRSDGFTVVYHDLDAGKTISSALGNIVAERNVERLITFPVSDHRLQRRLSTLCHRHDLEWQQLEDPGFLTPRESFREFVGQRSDLRMAEFYKQQRKAGAMLLDDADGPLGGKWSFDADNRRKLPRQQKAPLLPIPGRSSIVVDTIREIAGRFPENPGSAGDLWLPTNRRGALEWLQAFVDERLVGFGTYEDAVSSRSATLFHSTLSPLLNLGLLTPEEVLQCVLAKASSSDVPLNDLEGFVRQIVGWREFVRGVYEHFGEQMRTENRRGNARYLTAHWSDATTGIPPLDAAIEQQRELGWTHHINRLMVVSNLMNLCEIAPGAVYEYFMCNYIDAYDWVMVPNVFGMGLTSDTGVFATKPYVCGSNYLLKMSDSKRGEWCDVVDGLYWRFVSRNRSEYQSNPRLAMTLGTLDRMKPERAERIFSAAELFLARCTRLSPT